MPKAKKNSWLVRKAQKDYICARCSKKILRGHVYKLKQSNIKFGDLWKPYTERIHLRCPKNKGNEEDFKLERRRAQTQ